MNLLNFLNFKKKSKTPWNEYYKSEKIKFEVPEGSIYNLINKQVSERDGMYAYSYYGHNVTYKDFMRQIDSAARAFRCQGIRKGDVVTICMPNTPEAVISFYALNKIGAIASMIHPLSSEQEIKNYLINTNSVMMVMIDLCYEKVAGVIKETDVYKTIIVSAGSSMSMHMKLGYIFTKSYKIKKPYFRGEYLHWKDFIAKGNNYHGRVESETDKDTPAVILHSGGSTGIPKGIVLSNGNFNALAEQVKIIFTKLEPNDKILAIMPVFHGFGLGVSIHAVLHIGASVDLIPQFDARHFDKLIKKSNPSVIVGVPTLFEALLNTNNKKLDLSSLKYVVSGGDCLTESLGQRLNDFLLEHKCSVQVMQGYGLSEAVAATALAYGNHNILGSIGIPLPGNNFKIVRPNTQEELERGEVGEICISGPTVMMGYFNNEKETNDALQIHKDKNIWIHTGDMGYIREDGIIFYQSRLKRMIVSSGYNVYPQQIENVIESHEAVMKCTVIGIPHKYKVQVAKAIIVLKNGYSDSSSTKKSIKELCEKSLARYSLPYEYEFRKSLPKTLIGKVDFRKLSEEEENKNNGEN
ncbi:MAG: AMP-binding protein [Bacilli bacterium]|nr:AMP-binding protein [Bacilli bacterium]